MDEHFANFKAWYADVLERLYPDRRAGIAALMITLPLLERYLRLKTGLTPKKRLEGPYWSNLRAIFPALRSDKPAEDFWTVFRHGFLHQATLSGETWGGGELPVGRLTHDLPEPVWIESDGSFTVNPVSFSRVVVSVIEQDFDTFVGAESEAPSLPTVSERPDPSWPAAYPMKQQLTEITPTILSTSSRP